MLGLDNMQNKMRAHISFHVYEGNKESINQYKGVIITYSTAQRENAKSVSFQGFVNQSKCWD
jgi:ribosomal protein L19